MYKDLIEIPDISDRVFLDLIRLRETAAAVRFPDGVFLDLNLHQVVRKSC